MQADSPASSRTSSRPVGSVLLVLLILASACSNASPTSVAVKAPASTFEVIPLASADEGRVATPPVLPAAPPTTGTAEFSSKPGFVLPQSVLDGLAQASPASSTVVANNSTAAPLPEPTDTRAPAPTVPAVPADPTTQYQGFLGTLGLDTVVSAAVSPAPVAAPGTHPLTGLPGTPQNRAALVVKIDNSERARPHTGLEAADLIFEEEVEGGITRLAAVFHSAGGDIGPVRSGRTTDISYLSGLGRPILAYSGANELTEAMLLRQELVQNLGALRFGGYSRSSSRSAPHNMYTSAPQLWGGAAASVPPAQFTYRSADAAPRGREVTGATVAFPGVIIDWSWSGTAWTRSQGGTAHVMGNGTVLTAANVVVVEVAEIPTGMKDSGGAVVPEFVFVGTGPATVMSEGRAVSGIWTRPTLRDAATLTRGDGSVIELTPGVTWIEITTPGALRTR